MLTKDLLKFRVRSGVIHPTFVSEDNSVAHAAAQELLAIANSAVGQSRADLEERLKDLDHQITAFPGFKKILLDHCQFEEDTASAEDIRWARLIGAQAIRNQCDFATLADYQAALAAHFDLSFMQISEGLFSDLPEQRKLLSINLGEASDLIHRYNCQQVQGLLLKAENLRLKIKSADIGLRRSLFRSLKFHQLLVTNLKEVEANRSDDLEILVNGPLSMFEHSALYGIKFANFFPKILDFPKWELSADIELKQKVGRLVLSEKNKIRSYRQANSDYVPEELGKFVESFNRQKKEWKAEISGNFIDLGRESYCCADLRFCHPRREPVEMELFHKWHAGQLSQRLEILQQSDQSSFLIGVCQRVAKSPEICQVLDNSSWFARYGFVFKDFPSSRQIQDMLNRLSQ